MGNQTDLDEASSDMAFADFDNDGEDYILSATEKLMKSHCIKWKITTTAGNLRMIINRLCTD